MPITTSKYGTLPNGEDVTLFTITAGKYSAKIITFGGVSYPPTPSLTPNIHMRESMRNARCLNAAVHERACTHTSCHTISCESTCHCTLTIPSNFFHPYADAYAVPHLAGDARPKGRSGRHCAWVCSHTHTPTMQPPALSCPPTSRPTHSLTHSTPQPLPTLPLYSVTQLMLLNTCIVRILSTVLFRCVLLLSASSSSIARQHFSSGLEPLSFLWCASLSATRAFTLSLVDVVCNRFQ